MAKRKNSKSKNPWKLSKKELKAVYDKVRREFSAADLQKYTEIEEMIPLTEVVAKVDALHKNYLSKRKRLTAARPKKRKSRI